MCNLYSLTVGQVAIREAVRAMVDHAANLPPRPGILPDYPPPDCPPWPGRPRADGGAPGYAVPDRVLTAVAWGEKQDASP